jgi:hypothetical protein
LERLGRADQTHAAAPATIGEEKLVPESIVTPSGVPSVSRATGVSSETASPGAARSIAALRLLNDAGASAWLTAATLRTCGHAAGKLGALPACASLPPAATTSAPTP